MNRSQAPSDLERRCGSHAIVPCASPARLRSRSLFSVVGVVNYGVGVEVRDIDLDELGVDVGDRLMVETGRGDVCQADVIASNGRRIVRAWGLDVPDMEHVHVRRPR